MSNEDSAASPHRRPSPARTPLWLRLMFVVAVFFTIIGLVESAFQAVNLATGGMLVARLTPDLGLGIRSWTTHHAMRPGYDIPPVKTNSFGLRSPEPRIPKPAGTYRILLLGDSFTFGFKATEETTFARKLERQLHDTGFTSVEVVNAGVLSYCPLLEYLQYKQHLQVLEPDVVVLNFDMSDVQDTLDYSRSLVSSSEGEPLFVTEPSLRPMSASALPLLSFRWAARYLGALRRRGSAAAGGERLILDRDRYAWALDNGHVDEGEVRQTLEPIAWLAKLLVHERVPLVLATYPQPWQVSGDATPLPPIRDQYGIGRGVVHLNDRPFRALEAFASAHGLPFVNATDAFRKADKPAGLFMDDDFHFSPQGNALYADVLSRFLVEHSLAGGR